MHLLRRACVPWPRVLLATPVSAVLSSQLLGGKRSFQGAVQCLAQSATTTGTQLGGAQADHILLYELLEQIKTHNNLYYNQQPSLKDEQFDSLVKSFEQCCKRIELKDKSFVRPALPVGAPPAQEITKFRQVRHAVNMLSLASYDSMGKVQEWFERISNRAALQSICNRELLWENQKWVIEPKMDGLAVRLLYKGGLLVEAATRGNGEIGEDVLKNIIQVKGVVVKLEPKDSVEVPQLLEVRGEVYISNADFQIINQQRKEQGQEEYANQRNLASGSLRLIDSGECANRRLSFVAFQALFEGELDSTLRNTVPDSVFGFHSARLYWLQKQNIPIHDPQHFITVQGFSSALEAGDQMLKHLRTTLGAPVDGIVIKLDDIELQKQLGDDGHDPRWAVAMKFPPTAHYTTVTSIDLTVGRTGQLTPVINLEPINISGAVITRASAHNVDNLAKLDIGIGDLVELKRSGEVIPQVVRKINQSNRSRWKPPKKCPKCGSKLDKELDSGLIIRCSNENCGAKRTRQLQHYASLCFKGIGNKLILKLQDSGLVDNPTDFYKLTKEQLMKLDKIQDKSSEIILQAIEDSKKLPDYVILQGVGVRFVGIVQAKAIVQRFTSVEELLNASKQDFSSIEGIGPISAASVYEWIQDTDNRSMLRELWYILRDKTYMSETNVKSSEEKLLNLDSESESGLQDISEPLLYSRDEQPLNGIKILVTGVIPDLARQEVTQLLGQLGAQLTSTISGSLDILVLGNLPGQAKIQKAKKFNNIQVIQWQDFVKDYDLSKYLSPGDQQEDQQIDTKQPSKDSQPESLGGQETLAKLHQSKQLTQERDNMYRKFIKEAASQGLKVHFYGIDARDVSLDSQEQSNQVQTFEDAPDFIVISGHSSRKVPVVRIGDDQDWPLAFQTLQDQYDLKKQKIVFDIAVIQEISESEMQKLKSQVEFAGGVVGNEIESGNLIIVSNSKPNAQQIQNGRTYIRLDELRQQLAIAQLLQKLSKDQQHLEQLEQHDQQQSKHQPRLEVQENLDQQLQGNDNNNNTSEGNGHFAHLNGTSLLVDEGIIGNNFDNDVQANEEVDSQGRTQQRVYLVGNHPNRGIKKNQWIEEIQKMGYQVVNSLEDGVDMVVIGNASKPAQQKALDSAKVTKYQIFRYKEFQKFVMQQSSSSSQ
eukprot:TRINITY_DN1922_c0_g1_i7.p1 TRINITY_DN1922_c0_g1~~TRINITY_DN1922_c0_g1_i7.p1  ORF type:complete len:1160 (+),score=143.78 TRINITY_DN1922_c0_g1_i7:73-3552(+)